MSDRHDSESSLLVKRVRVPIGPEAAFELFTHGFAHWWPLATHSVGQGDALDCRMEERAGGQIVELDRDGSTHVWGTIRTWLPPNLLSFTWHPGRAADTAQSIEVRFAAIDGGGTFVTLEHGGWDEYGVGAGTMRDNYDRGWDFVLGERFAGTARDT
jgi:uncharacterized protein YndB with AHSA1/START domain